MFAQMLVTFELFDDHVEYVETDPEVRFASAMMSSQSYG